MANEHENRILSWGPPQWIRVRMPGRGGAPVIFGEPGDEPLLGATTLESLGLVLDPFKRRLIPMRMMLA